MAFFFFFDNEYENLENNKVFRYAFNRALFSKLENDGYCNIGLITKSDYTKELIKEKLKRNNSPLFKMYELRYDKAFLNDIVPQILDDMIIYAYSKSSDELLDDFECFAIVMFVYKSVDKENYLLDLYKRWGNHNHINLKIKNNIAYDADRIELNIVGSVEEYINVLHKTMRTEDEKVFFRGHSDCSYNLRPSLFRKKEWIDNEKKMYLELLSRCPSDFMNMNSNIEKLAEMQHYGLSTRLLDITSNPLIALYFACESHNDKPGEVIAFRVDKRDIEYTQGQKVALLSAIPFFSRDEQQKIYNDLKGNNLKKSVEYNNLVKTSLQSDESIYNSKIVNDAVVYVPTRNNKRIDNQDGAFFVFGLVDEIYDEKISVSSLDKYRLKWNAKNLVIIIDSNKELIMEMLDVLGINKAKVYPEIDDVADYIKKNINRI